MTRFDEIFPALNAAAMRASCAPCARTWPAAAALACGGRGACVVLRRIQVWNSCVWITSLCPLLPSPATLHCTRSYVCSVFLSGPIRPNIALAFAFAFKVEVFWEGLKIFKKFPFIFDFYLIGHNVKSKWKIFSNFVAFSEFINFKGGSISRRHFHLRPDPQKNLRNYYLHTWTKVKIPF